MQNTDFFAIYFPLLGFCWCGGIRTLLSITYCHGLVSFGCARALERHNVLEKQGTEPGRDARASHLATRNYLRRAGCNYNHAEAQPGCEFISFNETHYPAVCSVACLWCWRRR